VSTRGSWAKNEPAVKVREEGFLDKDITWKVNRPKKRDRVRRPRRSLQPHKRGFALARAAKETVGRAAREEGGLREKVKGEALPPAEVEGRR